MIKTVSRYVYEAFSEGGYVVVVKYESNRPTRILKYYLYKNIPIEEALNYTINKEKIC